MIEATVEYLLALDAKAASKRLTILVDEFRSGRNSSEILELLSSANPNIVGVGVWIIKELPERYYTQEIVARLWQLSDSPESSTRFHILGALFPFLDANSKETRELIVRYQNDSNDGVRHSANNASRRLNIE